MQSLLSTVITKLSDKIEELHGVPLPRTLVDACRAARKSRFDMQELYEVHLGPIHPGYIGYCRSGHVDILKTLEKLSRFDKPLAFKYYSALNDKEKLKEIWEAISVEDREGLLADKELVIAYRAREFHMGSEHPVESPDTVKFLTDCLSRRWEKPFSDVFPKLEMKYKVIVLAFAWSIALIMLRHPNGDQNHNFLLQMMRTILEKRNIEFNEESCSGARESIRHFYYKLFNIWRDFCTIYACSPVPEFDRIMREITEERTIAAFRAEYESKLGAIPREHFQFDEFGQVHQILTAENLIEHDKILAFGYCAYFDRFSAMIRIWKRLSEDEKSRMENHPLKCVSLRAQELVQNVLTTRKGKKRKFAKF